MTACPAGDVCVLLILLSPVHSRGQGQGQHSVSVRPTHAVSECVFPAMILELPEVSVIQGPYLYTTWEHGPRAAA